RTVKWLLEHPEHQNINEGTEAKIENVLKAYKGL
ncbi:MAG TPA: NAD-dependent dehydratase, partial [Maribacter sp.]|nr:NAD-dependent dehydratase [Maribacter sp.]